MTYPQPPTQSFAPGIAQRPGGTSSPPMRSANRRATSSAANSPTGTSALNPATPSTIGRLSSGAAPSESFSHVHLAPEALVPYWIDEPGHPTPRVGKKTASATPHNPYVRACATCRSIVLSLPRCPLCVTLVPATGISLSTFPLDSFRRTFDASRANTLRARHSPSSCSMRFEGVVVARRGAPRVPRRAARLPSPPSTD
ncbi:hypothetical protein MPH_02223 [Macrophomina phaseolina MS6]|uniref:Uncharacterized protein n=1 Tax=Macrophomina phaseolina (strain MS6) TaxID=1126212 RepID=K2SV38_MACPH|nr:hypothetical protein MPH_02223 [Macrophomina phaseolina MS6]